MGLLKTGMKAAVAVKTADVIHERIQRRQHEQWAAYGHPGGTAATGSPAPAGVPAAPARAAPAAAVPQAAVPAAADTASMLAQLTQLGELRASGVLTEAEFEVQKARILSG
jgi:Short C-terminal domain